MGSPDRGQLSDMPQTVSMGCAKTIIAAAEPGASRPDTRGNGRESTGSFGSPVRHPPCPSLAQVASGSPPQSTRLTSHAGRCSGCTDHKGRARGGISCSLWCLVDTDVSHSSPPRSSRWRQTPTGRERQPPGRHQHLLSTCSSNAHSRGHPHWLRNVSASPRRGPPRRQLALSPIR